MAFGQPQGPPASKRQLDRLLDLVIAAGHEDFRDARGPLGLTQRQANGKFTRDEADELIEQLETGSGRRADRRHSPLRNAPSDRCRPRRSLPNCSDVAGW